MKKIFSIIAVITALTLSGCANNFLETDPTDQVATGSLMSDATSAMTALNGIYRCLFWGGWGDGWEPENGGLPAYITMFDLYAEDHIMDDMGSGWFYYDYAYNTWTDYTHDASHSYNVWNFCYTLIANANNLIASVPEMTGDEGLKQSVLGQAYAIRANAYWWLANAYCQNGGPAGDSRRTEVKGVPVYTEPTTIKSEGVGRGTIQQTYDRINADIDSAIVYLEACGVDQMHISHINTYVAYGLKSRFAMTQNDYATAYEFAVKAMNAGEIADYSSDAPAVNNSAAKNVMWALEIQADQVRYSVYEHLDADCGGTYSVARHIVGNWLFDHIPATDGRRSWWTSPLPEEEWGEPGTSNGSKRSWCQKKLKFINPVSQTGDHILMRVEEMYLNAAESACHLGDWDNARKYISMLGEMRMTDDYAARLALFENSAVASETTAEPKTLMDEILLQRRIELWGEFPRIFDLQRLDLGFTRYWDDESNHLEFLDGMNTEPRSYNFILPIPDSEFNGNKAMDRLADQNPNPDWE